MSWSIREIIRAKRDREILSTAAISHFVDAMVTEPRASDGQIAAFAMATLLNGMNARECADLTLAMTRSGSCLTWPAELLDGPCLDKHSTGGVGDKVSLLLAPMLAACGAYVPMISGRGLGHTGGTLDKLEAIPGYCSTISLQQIYALTRECGCVIVSPTVEIAPADARLYAIRDLTATVESIALVTASILSKKLAAGVRHLVMDVKVGNGAFTETPEAGRVLAQSLVDVAAGAGLTTTALLTDMNQVLGHSAGNALEVFEVLAALRADSLDGRLAEVTFALGQELLVSAGLAINADDARIRLQRCLSDGTAAERFERMVAALGGPHDLLERAESLLPCASLVLEVPSPRAGVVARIDTRQLGLVVIMLGGGREVAGSSIDPSVGLSAVVGLGEPVTAGQPLALVHAADSATGAAAVSAVLRAISIADAPILSAPVMYERIAADC